MRGRDLAGEPIYKAAPTTNGNRRLVPVRLFFLLYLYRKNERELTRTNIFRQNGIGLLTRDKLFCPNHPNHVIYIGLDGWTKMSLPLFHRSKVRFYCQRGTASLAARYRRADSQVLPRWGRGT